MHIVLNWHCYFDVIRVKREDYTIYVLAMADVNDLSTLLRSLFEPRAPTRCEDGVMCVGQYNIA